MNFLLRLCNSFYSTLSGREAKCHASNQCSDHRIISLLDLCVMYILHWRLRLQQSHLETLH